MANLVSVSNAVLSGGLKQPASQSSKLWSSSAGTGPRRSIGSKSRTSSAWNLFLRKATSSFSGPSESVLCREPDYAGWREVSPLSDRLLVLSARHSPVAQLKVAEETQQTVGGTITTW